MSEVILGRTGITVNKNGFGALPIQRITKEQAAALLQQAYDGGITFFDTARAYTDSEEKLGYALSHVRSHIYLATKTAAQTADDFWKDLETSLKLLKTDCIDIYQFHNPAFCPKPGDESGLYDAALKAKEQGNPLYRNYQPSSVGCSGGHRLRTLRYPSVPFLLSGNGKGSGSGSGL